jgi:hypothetical protein
MQPIRVSSMEQASYTPIPEVYDKDASHSGSSSCHMRATHKDPAHVQTY